MNRRTFAIAVALTMGVVPALAQEAGPSAENVAAAKTLFDDAQKAMDEKRYPDACAKFLASEQKVAKIGTLLNLGDCYEKNGQSASAWITYNEAISLGRKQRRPEYEEFAKKKAQDLEGKLVQLTIVVPPAVRTEGLQITRDGTPVAEGEWGTGLPVDPGAHVLVVTATKKQRWQSEVKVAADKSLTVTIPALEDAPQTVWPPAQQPEVVEKVVVKQGPFTPLRIAGIATGTLGIGGLVTGSILGIAAKSSYDGALKKCGGNPSNCTQDAISDSRTAHAMADVATVLFVIGGVATAAGITMFLLGAPRDLPVGATARVRPVLSPFGGGVEGTF